MAVSPNGGLSKNHCPDLSQWVDPALEDLPNAVVLIALCASLPTAIQQSWCPLPSLSLVEPGKTVFFVGSLSISSGPHLSAQFWASSGEKHTYRDVGPWG